MNLSFASLISRYSYLNTFEGNFLFIIFGKNKDFCKFTSLVPSCHCALQTAPFLLPGLHSVEMASAFLFLCCILVLLHVW